MRERARRITVWPRRDWRFWGAIAAVGAVVIILIAFGQLIGQRDDLRADNRRLVLQIDVSSVQQECRSRAAVFADTVGAEAFIVLSEGLTSLARGESIEPYADALDVANANYSVALRARDDAVHRCVDDPDYSIEPTILTPLPPIPSGG